MITAERLREAMHYAPSSGVFIWADCFGRGRSGKVAGCKNMYGYWQIKIDGRTYAAHRLAWLYMTGEWPPMIDHKDGDRLHNEFDNLRLCSGSQNNGNMRKPDRNKSGYKGVYKNGAYSTWVARIGPQKNRRFLGCYADPRIAAAAYDAAAIELFGDFARTNRSMGLLD